MRKNPPEFWENKRFALYSANLERFPQEALERMQRRGWKPGLQSSRMEACLQAVQSNECSVLLIHDTPEGPASFILRAQIANPVAIITPTMVIVDPSHAVEAAQLKDFGQPEMIDLEASAASFIDGFEYLTRRWQTGNLRELTNARKMYIQKDLKAAAKLLMTLRSEVDVQHLVTPCVAQLLLRQGQFKSVESYLLDALKVYPRNLGLVANLSELYLKAAMPGMTLKILEAARKNHGSLRTLYYDMIQAHLMLNQVKECIPLLESLIQENYRSKEAAECLARCLMAEGFESRLEDLALFGSRDQAVIKSDWAKLVS